MRSKTFQIVLATALALMGGCKAQRAIQADPSYEDPKGHVEDPGASDAYLVVNGKVSHNFGNKNTATNTDVELTLVNQGTKDATNIAVSTSLSAPFSFLGGSYPGTGGTCPTGTLAAQTSCSIWVRYSPTVTGTFSGVFVLGYKSDGIAKTFSFGVQGSSGSATVSISGAPLYTFANTLIGAVSSHTFTVTNSGALTARFLTDAGTTVSPFSYKGGAYPGTGGTCAAELEATETCTLVVDFSPTSSGLHTSPLAIGYVSSGTAGAAAISLQGSSGNAVLSITNSPLYTYATTFTGATLDRTFTITNTGSFEATNITDMAGLAAPFAYAGGLGYPGTAGTCTGTLAAGSSCTIVVRFSPTLPETSTDALDIQYYDGEITQTLALNLSGPGRGAVLEATVGTTYDFNLVAKNSLNEGTITIQNTGNYQAASLTITDNLTGTFRYKGFAYPGTGGSCSTTLAAGASCTMVVEYAPTGSGTAIINSSDNTILRYNPGSGTTVNLTLTVQGRAGLASLTFGSGAWGTVVNSSNTERSITVTNSGTYPATSLGLQTAPSVPFYFVGGSYPGTNGGTCGNNLAPGGSCSLRLRFNPTSVGAYSDAVVLQYNNGETTLTPSGTLTGTSALASLSISDSPSFDYGSVAYSSATSTHTFTVTNSGAYAASSVSLSGLSVPFTRVGGSCGTSLAAGATCTHQIRFTPTAETTYNDSFSIDYNDGEQAQSFNQDLVGTGLNVAPVANSQSPSVPMDDPGQTITLTSSDANGNSRTYEILSLPSNGTLNVGVGVIGGSSVVYTPNASYTGADSFTFRVNDGMLDSGAATVSITVTP